VSFEFNHASACTCSHSCRRRRACSSADAAARRRFTCISVSPLSSFATLKALLPFRAAAQKAASVAPTSPFDVLMSSEGAKQAVTIADTCMVSRITPGGSRDSMQSCAALRLCIQSLKMLVKILLEREECTSQFQGEQRIHSSKGSCEACCRVTGCLVCPCPCPYHFYWIARVHPQRSKT
jgi:hypothetical protein